MAKTASRERSDESLVLAMAEGDESALRELNSRYGDAVVAVASRILGPGPDSAEIAADVLWQAWRQAGLFDGNRATVGAWLVTMTRSRAIDRWRIQHRRREIISEDHDAQTHDDRWSELYAEERRKKVLAAVSNLKDEERKLVELAYLSDLSRSEIAQRTGLPVGTVKSRLRSALIRLRNALKEVD